MTPSLAAQIAARLNELLPRNFSPAEAIGNGCFIAGWPDRQAPNLVSSRRDRPWGHDPSQRVSFLVRAAPLEKRAPSCVGLPGRSYWGEIKANAATEGQAIAKC